ncbi:hypothetical protein V6N11_008697 [Hibiscus sabdariffa]|uniref:Uncharacterized protein n=1 Tax=Hibiscus sabdariffa TaxID=183260 RepID=A0ABR2PPC9_9ROSI
MVGYGSDSCQGVKPTAPSFSTPTTPTRSTSGFSSMPVSFMAHPAAWYVDAVSPSSGQDVVWYPDSRATHHITNNRGILQLDVVYTGATSFPLVLVNGEEKLVDQPSGKESLDQPKCHECVGVTSGSSPVHADLLYPELVLDQTSEQSGDPELGPGLKQLQSAKGANNIGSCSTGSPCVDPINKGADSSLLELGCVQESASEDRGKGLDSDLNFTQRDDGGIPQSDLGLPCSSTHLEYFDSQPDKLCLHEDPVTSSSPFISQACQDKVDLRK